MPSQLCPPEIGPAHGPGPPGAGAVNTVKHCLLKRHGRSLSVVQLRGFVKEKFVDVKIRLSRALQFG